MRVVMVWVSSSRCVLSTSTQGACAPVAAHQFAYVVVAVLAAVSPGSLVLVTRPKAS